VLHQGTSHSGSPFDLIETRINMISDKLYQFAVSDKSVSSELAENPNQSPGEIVNRLFKHKQEATGDNPELPTRADGEEANLQRALECGNWGGQRPSNLFLKVRLYTYTINASN
jgi:hypothetical protein